MIVQPVNIRDLRLESNLVLSPMSGITTSAFRRLIKELNPGAVGLLVSEFISVEALTRKVPRSLSMMRYHTMERPVSIQIFGFDINRIRDAAMMVQDCGADIVDLNCGCPAPKVVRKGGGCELMRQPEHLAKILRTVRAAVTIPFTMKFRSGWDEASKNAVIIAQIAEAEGVEAIAVHGRTRAQLYRGFADWDIVAEIAEAVKIPVFGSGDITSYAVARQRLHGKVAGLFIGRGALSNPFVFKEIATNEGVPMHAELALSVLERYGALLREEFGPVAVMGKLKQLASQMCRGIAWRKPLLQTATPHDLDVFLLRLREQGECATAPSSSIAA